jgi:hypothetical protein
MHHRAPSLAAHTGTYEVCPLPLDTAARKRVSRRVGELGSDDVVGFLSLGDSAGARIRLCRWADVGGGWSPVRVAEYGAQRSEDVYFPGQVQRVLMRGSYPGDRPVWRRGGRQQQGVGDLVHARWPR